MSGKRHKKELWLDPRAKLFLILMCVLSSMFAPSLAYQFILVMLIAILGGLDWNVAGRYHDALKLGYANKNNEVHLILAFNQNNDNRTSGGTYYDSSTGQPYKNMQTVWYHYKADNVPFGASLLFMNLGLETGDKATDDSHTRYLQTMGTYLTYKNSNWNLDGAFYYQMGKNKAADRKSTRLNSSHWNKSRMPSSA